MRIRKRFPLSSSLSSLPFSSDPQLNRPPVVQQHTQPQDGNLCVQKGSSTSQPSDLPNQLLPRPSDRKSMIGSENTSWVCSINTNKAQEELEYEEEVKKETSRNLIVGLSCCVEGFGFICVILVGGHDVWLWGSF